MPAKTTPAAASKPPAPANEKADSARPDRVSFGLLSLLVGCVALSFYSVPFLVVRIFAVMLSLAGISLAVLQFRTAEKAGRNFNGALAGTMFSAAVILLTTIGPYLPAAGPRVARAPTRTNAPKPMQTARQPTVSLPQAAQVASQPTPDTAEQPSEVPQIPANVPKVIPFPCRKNFMLVPIAAPEWADAASAAVLQGEVAVCIPSVTIEKLELHPESKSISSDEKHLVIHLQVVLIGTTRKVDLESWGNSNFGEARNKPTLTDNSNHAYRLRTFDAGTQVAGHERSKDLYPKLYADDYLILETPGPNVEYLRLELPASAFGEMGTLRFQIAKSMIEGVKDSEPAK